ncbi:hypothetical protein FB390_2750 [Nocardia bhagyanarayanae]|uniref:Uncharacterized protein n=1 Tax=Nocardia bhagyanarayanae TaxID=1215925 RepID=A0A543FBD0_9NOCA|nr:hypothetical protein FB390_2750 [Nocardia bhagyanarayanae]
MYRCGPVIWVSIAGSAGSLVRLGAECGDRGDDARRSTGSGRLRAGADR